MDWEFACGLAFCLSLPLDSKLHEGKACVPVYWGLFSGNVCEGASAWQHLLFLDSFNFSNGLEQRALGIENRAWSPPRVVLFSFLSHLLLNVCDIFYTQFQPLTFIFKNEIYHLYKRTCKLTYTVWIIIKQVTLYSRSSLRIAYSPKHSKLAWAPLISHFPFSPEVTNFLNFVLIFFAVLSHMDNS